MTVSTADFTYTARDNTFVTEASNLPRDVMAAAARGYSSARLMLKSHLTGREVAFLLDSVERDREGELVAFVFRPVDRSLWACGTVRIFND